MRKVIMLVVLVLVFSAQSLFALTGREVMERTAKIPEPKSTRVKTVMTIENEGYKQTKEFSMMSKSSSDVHKSLFSFIRPTRVKVLSCSYKGRDAEQWVSLSSGKVKRVIGSDKGGAFANSHLSYADLQTRNIDDFDYKLLGMEKVMGFNCYKIESHRLNGTKIYSRTVLYVRDTDYFVVRIDIDQEGKFLKYLENHDIRMVSGIPTPYRIEMKLASGLGKTTMEVKTLEYNMNIPDSEFSKENMN